MEYLFGPVPSRRLGFSLGIDVIPHKTCSFDCIYCEIGKTTHRTIDPVSGIPAETVLAELKEYLQSTSVRIDYITLSGSGEPTLHPNLGSIIRAIKAMTSIPVAVITNGSLFYKEEMREQVLGADLIIPSLDAVDPAALAAVNRPHPALKLAPILEGLIALGQARRSQLWLEVLLVKGLNDRPEQIEKLARLVEQINPDKVQLNTVVRPPVEARARPLAFQALEEIQKKLGSKAEVIVRPDQVRSQSPGSMLEDQVLEMVSRRPCTVEDIVQCLGAPPEETVSILDRLMEERKLICEQFSHKNFFRSLNSGTP